MKLKYLPLVSALCMVSFAAPSYAQNAQIDTSTSEAVTPRPDKASDVVPTPEEDKVINESIKSNIQNSSTLSNLNVDVQTNRGIVTFTGQVDSDSQASSLIELAQSIIGVKDIEAANLKVKDSQEPFADMMTTAKIKGMLIREKIFGGKDLASINMSVETRNGVVYLTGAVDNQAQVKNAIKLIEGMKGVKKVEYNVKKVMPNSMHNHQ